MTISFYLQSKITVDLVNYLDTVNCLLLTKKFTKSVDYCIRNNRPRIVITFIVKFRLTAKVCMLSHLFPQNIFAVASVRLEFFGPLAKLKQQHVAPLLLTFRDNLEQLENSLLISEQSYNGKS